MIRRTWLAWFIAAAVTAGVGGLQAFQTPLQKVKINFPTRSSASWPMFIAKEGGYYEKYGLDVELVFGAGSLGVVMISNGEAVMTNSSMEQALQASARDAILVSMGSSLNKGLFALISAKDVPDVKALKGKRVAVSQIGDAPYNYSLALFGKFGLTSRDINWISVGTDATARLAALAGSRVDATLLTAPQYFRAQEQGFKVLANLSDHDDIYASTVYLFTKKAVAANPKMPELLIKAHTEAIKRFYDDKAFAIKAYIVYDKQQEADVTRIYDMNAKGNLFERIPYVLSTAVNATRQQADAQATTQLGSRFDPKAVIDNSVVDRLVKEGYFEKLFGASIKSEIDRKSKIALR